MCRSKKEPHGRRHRVYVVMDDDGPDGERIPSSNAPDGTERVLVDRLPDNVSLAVAQERVRGLEDMVEVLNGQLKVERERYNELINNLSTGRPLVLRAERQRPWWRFWTGVR